MNKRLELEEKLGLIDGYISRIKKVEYEGREELEGITVDLLKELPARIDEMKDYCNDVLAIKYMPTVITDFTNYDDLVRYWMLGQSELVYILGKLRKGIDAGLQSRIQKEEGFEEEIAQLKATDVIVLHCGDDSYSDAVCGYIGNSGKLAKSINGADEYGAKAIKLLTQSDGEKYLAFVLYSPDELDGRLASVNEAVRAGMSAGYLESWLGRDKVLLLNGSFDETLSEEACSIIDDMLRA